MTIAAQVLGGAAAAASDREGVFRFEGEAMPAWLDAVRETQDDGSPGTFLVRPSRRNFEERWTEIVEAMRPFGMRLGIIKVRVPPEW